MTNTRRVPMNKNKITNFVDEKTARKIIDALCRLDFKSITKLADDSGVPVNRLQNFIEGTEKITQLDKGKLIIHLINLADMAEDISTKEEPPEIKYTSLKDFQKRKAG